MRLKSRQKMVLYGLLVFALVFCAGTPAASAVVLTAESGETSAPGESQAKIHDSLLGLARDGSDQLVPVIIQAHRSVEDLARTVTWSGVIVTGQFPFINAVSALAPASALLTLADSPEIKWISPNGQMISTQMLNAVVVRKSVADDFSTNSFSGGIAGWATPWLENDPAINGIGPLGGRVGVSNGALYMHDYPDTGGYPSAARVIDLSPADEATLSFAFATSWGVDWEDAVALEISTDGVNFSRLDTFTGFQGTTKGERTYDISGYRSATTTIRFRVVNMYGGSYERFYVDDVKIEYAEQETVSDPDPNANLTPVTDGTVRDNFDIDAYDNNDGSRFWSSPWRETLDDGSPTGGKLKISGGYLELKMDGSFGKSVYRETNLAGVDSAQFRYFLQESSLNNDDAVTVEASRNGGGSWVTLTTITPGTADNQSYSFDLFQALGDVTSDTVVRFRQSGGSGGDKIRVGHAEIAFHYAQPIYDPVFTSWASSLGTVENYEWFDGEKTVEANGFGPDGLYGYGADGKASFAGFDASPTPNHRISKVELLLVGYARQQIVDEEFKFRVYVAGDKLSEVKHPSAIFDANVGADNPGTVVVDLTASHEWQWVDFYNDLQIFIEHDGFKDDENEFIHYDAIGLKVTAIPGVDNSHANIVFSGDVPKEAFDASNISQAFPFAVRAPDVWNEAPNYIQGQDVTAAIVDSGVNFKVKDLKGRRTKDVNFSHGFKDGKDKYGHGTFVAVTAAGDGEASDGEYTGIAPRLNLVNVRVSNDQGMSTEGDVLHALQWVFDNAEDEGIRVVNLSLNSTVAQSYHTSPLAAGVEMLWLKGIVVVVSAGNNGSADLYPPANSPRVITVGATDDQGTPGLADDTIAHFSAWGVDEAGNAKPDLVAPGTNIIAYVPKHGSLTMGKAHREHAVDKDYFRMSGTSMSAPMVTAAVAMLLQDEPELTPDQVKYRLMDTANSDWPGYDPAKAGAGYLDIYAAIHGTSTAYANQGLAPSQLLRPVIADILGDEFLDEGFTWDSVNWNSVNWNSVNWNSGFTWSSGFTWGSVNWNSVNWNSVNWNSVNWNSDFWDDSFAATQQVRDRLMQPIPVTPEEQVEINRIFLPAVQSQ